MEFASTIDIKDSGRTTAEVANILNRVDFVDLW
jgi:hypothetical protein